MDVVQDFEEEAEGDVGTRIHSPQVDSFNREYLGTQLDKVDKE